MKHSHSIKASKLFWLAILSFVAGATGGCAAGTESDDVPSIEEPVATTMEQALRDPGYMATPAGAIHRRCVYQLDDGDSIEENGEIKKRDGSMHRLAKCAHPAFLRNQTASKFEAAESAEETPAAGSVVKANGWLTGGWWTARPWIRRYWANMYVPDPPKSNDGQILFFFPSLVNNAGNTIIQPVLEYGPNGGGTGYFWTMAAWYVWPHDGNAVTSNHVRVNKGDRIWCGMEGNDCKSDGSGCHWAVIARNATTGQKVRIDVKSAVSYHAAQSGIMEVYNVSRCSQLPPNNSVSFDGHQLFDGAFRRVSPQFKEMYWKTICASASGVVPAGPTTITWNARKALL